MSGDAIIVASCILALVIYTADATCDTSACPWVCKGLNCPQAGDPFIPNDPFPNNCQEVYIETIGYPHGYPAGPCRWKFESLPKTSSIMLSILDFDGEDTDILYVHREYDDPGGAGTFPNDIFMGNSDDAAGALTRNIRARGSRVFVEWDAAKIAYDRRGFRIRLMFADSDANTACTTTEEVVLTPEMQAAAVVTPDHPLNYDRAVECYYHVVSPEGSQILLELLGNLQLANDEDFVFLYDSRDAGNPVFLRIMSFRSAIPFDNYRTGTNNLQVVFQNNGDSNLRGFFIRFTYFAAYQACSGAGVNTDQCGCAGVDGGPRCEVDGDTDLQVIPTPSTAEELTEQCSASNTIVRLRYRSDMSNAIIGTTTFFTNSGPAETRCLWSVFGVPGCWMAIIFRAFDLEEGVDDLTIRYIDVGRPDYGYIMYSTPDTDLPVTRTGQTFPLLDTPILIDSSRIRFDYRGSTTDVATYPGFLAEIHILGKDTCDQSCLNGGRCEAFCTCVMGYQGEFCEQTTPPDYMCLVKNHYVTAHYAYPIEIHASAGNMTFTADKFTFDYYGPRDYDERLPSSATVTEEEYGNKLNLPSECDLKEGSSRFGALSCIFGGDDFVPPVTVPAIVNYKSEWIWPTGRPTITASVTEDVTLTVGVNEAKKKAIRWRFNGLLKSKWNGKSSIALSVVEVDDCGIYEAFLGSDNEREYNRVTYRLIVRGCPDAMWGPPDCDQPCLECENGGTCSAEFGICVCPPGYGGIRCETLTTQGTITQNTNYTCDVYTLSTDTCKGILFCLPDPAGCMCMSGWTGIECNERCPPLTFGLECQFNCNCAGGQQCDSATGACPNGCAASFGGPNCQNSIVD